MPSVEVEGKTVEEAVATALAQLGLKEEQVYIEVLSEANRKLFGLLGAKGFRVRVTPKEETNPHQPQEIVENLLRRMEIKASIQGRPGQEGYLIDITSPEGALIIGRGGRTLEALQYLANRIYHRRHPGGERLILDVGSYRVKREETLTEMAYRLAEKVKKTGEPITLEPLNPYDRRIIHLALQKTEGIKTFSRGEGYWKNLVISPS